MIEGTDLYFTPTLETRFARTTRVLRANAPLSKEQMRGAAPPVFAEGKHASRSDRYTYITTIDVLRGLRKEGFEPFMVARPAAACKVGVSTRVPAAASTGASA